MQPAAPNVSYQYSQPPYPSPASQQPPYPPTGPQQPYPPTGPQQSYPPTGPQQPYPPTSGQTPYPPTGGPAAYPPPGGQPPPKSGGGGGGGESTPEGSDNEDDGAGRAPILPTAPAPPTVGLEKFAGYENVTYNAAEAPPPPTYADSMGFSAPSAPPANRQVLPAQFELSTEDLRQALLDEVADHCCWGSRAAKNMNILKSELATALHYTLESFVERRSTSQAHRPYRGEMVDGRENGQPPGAWEISVNRPDPFQDRRNELAIPHTEYVRSCYRCNGMCMLMCVRCRGLGRTRCTFCHGTGRRTVYRDGHHHHEHCHTCHGRGRRQCWSCHGSGRVPCDVCDAVGRLKHYIKLTIDWQTHKKDFVIERTALPDELIVKVSGQETFREQFPRVYPLSSFPEPKIVEASQRLVHEHAALAGHSLILMQRHYLQLVPVFEVSFEHSDKERKYFVYGYERKVYAPEYPHQCCCGCSIL